MNISIGTAQFMSNYGVNRVPKSFNFNEKSKLIKSAQNNDVLHIDTAFSYGNAHKELGKIGIKKFKVTTKLPVISIKTKNLEKKITNLTFQATKDLKIKKIDTLLIHSYKNLIELNKKKYLESLKKMKSKGLVNNIGISLYKSNEVNKILKFWKPDVIQLPYNIFNRDIEVKKILPILKRKKIKVQVRSVFLQGLLTSNKRPKKFLKWKKYFDEWFQWCQKNQIESKTAALLFVKANKIIDRFIIGFENSKQLQDILKARKIKKQYSFPKIKCKDRKLLDPSNWSKLIK